MGSVVVEKWTPERRRQLTRDALIEAAIQVFARRGFHGASLEEIAETAGFTRGAIYKNFAGKEDLFLATFDRRVERNLAAFSDRLEPTSEMFFDLPRVVSVWRDILVPKDPDLLILDEEARLFAFRNPEFRERYAAHVRAEVEAIAAFIEDQAASAGVTMTVPPAAVAGIFARATEGFVAAAYLDPDQDNLYEVFLGLLNRVIFESGAEEPAPTELER